MSRPISRWSIAFALLPMLATGPAYAWGPDGHKIVAKIAYDQLSAKSKSAVDKLLDGDTLPGVSNWADTVRSTPAYAHTRGWHFADMDEGEDSFSLSRDCPDEGCVVQAIQDQTTTLASSDSSKSQKQEALRFIVHFVGDCHQPLHIGHKGDKGGNDIQVKFFGRSTKLHALWDSGLLSRSGLAWDKYAEKLEHELTPGNKATWQQTLDPADWASESHHLAEDHAYRTPNGDELTGGEVLTADYFKDNIDVVNEQLSKAGVRLASVLNGIFDPPDAPGRDGSSPPTDHPTPPGGDVHFVGSKSRNVYHLPGCRDVDRIDEDNLVRYEVAPPGKHLHKGCPK